MFSSSFACYSFPRFILLIAWELIVLWLGPSVAIQRKITKCRRMTIPIVFVIIDIVVLALNFCFSFLRQNEFANPKDNENDSNDPTTFLSYIGLAVTYFIIALFTGAYCIVLVHTVKVGKLNRQLKWRTKVLLLVTFIQCILYFARCFWNVAVVFGFNVIKDLWVTTFQECFQNGICWNYYLHYLAFYVIFDLLPSLLLLVAFSHITQRKQSNSASSSSKSSINSLSSYDIRGMASSASASSLALSTTSSQDSSLDTGSSSMSLRRPVIGTERNDILTGLNTTGYNNGYDFNLLSTDDSILDGKGRSKWRKNDKLRALQDTSQSDIRDGQSGGYTPQDMYSMYLAASFYGIQDQYGMIPIANTAAARETVPALEPCLGESPSSLTSKMHSSSSSSSSKKRPRDAGIYHSRSPSPSLSSSARHSPSSRAQPSIFTRREQHLPDSSDGIVSLLSPSYAQNGARLAGYIEKEEGQGNVYLQQSQYIRGSNEADGKENYSGRRSDMNDEAANYEADGSAISRDGYNYSDEAKRTVKKKKKKKKKKLKRMEIGDES
eukprot:MONOS_7846.1-p1 / transcript=MONOS_7846.1 / gene=MONOS_7846 / organism=Monocercomonoides_exilis_PA203 / gene_product=unspecified product / transcript_product=unspecified product / location=Mono_scaffold00279:69642-71576(+) / protein_length=551 / sequence_SO=supercontig / SO=protein_coding / is_pseudo=false